MIDADLVVTEGRAYHKGDVVLLRYRGSVTPKAIAHAQELLRVITDKTGVAFVLLDRDMEVVEPRENPR